MSASLPCRGTLGKEGLSSRGWACLRVKKLKSNPQSEFRKVVAKIVRLQRQVVGVFVCWGDLAGFLVESRSGSHGGGRWGRGKGGRKAGRKGGGRESGRDGDMCRGEKKRV